LLHSPDCPWTCCKVQTGLQLRILLPQLPKCGDYK
jgi:hypothetical protein